MRDERCDMAHCDKCGKNLALVGRRHDCVPIIPKKHIKRLLSAGKKVMEEREGMEAASFMGGVTAPDNSCPTCGHKRPMTGAERQRAYRMRRGAR